MFSAFDVMVEAKRSGRVWLGGEMEFPIGVTAQEAFDKMHRVACSCGYMVRRSKAGTEIEVYGGAGWGDSYYTLIWENVECAGPSRVLLFRADSAGMAVARGLTGTIILGPVY